MADKFWFSGKLSARPAKQGVISGETHHAESDFGVCNTHFKDEIAECNTRACRPWPDSFLIMRNSKLEGELCHGCRGDCRNPASSKRIGNKSCIRAEHRNCS